jgi:hypothetical protein
MERCRSRMQPKSHIHTPEGMNPHIHKWTPILGIGIPMKSQIFRNRFKRSKFIGLKISLYHWKSFKTYISKLHLNTYNTSYGKKKNRDSKCQFHYWPLKVKNCLELRVCKWLATYRWKDFDESYNFSLDLTLIEGLHKKFYLQNVGSSNFKKFEILNVEVLGKVTFGCKPYG